MNPPEFRSILAANPVPAQEQFINRDEKHIQIVGRPEKIRSGMPGQDPAREILE